MLLISFHKFFGGLSKHTTDIPGKRMIEQTYQSPVYVVTSHLLQVSNVLGGGGDGDGMAK